MKFVNKPTFIIPHYAETDNEYNILFLKNMFEGLHKQTDSNWNAVVIDDCSKSSQVKLFLHEMANSYPNKIHVIFLEQNVGPGACRNIGILWARNKQSPFVLFNDADDISHPKRLELTQKIFKNEPTIGLVYSTFKVIDENNNFIPLNEISTPILEILESHQVQPLEGEDAWIHMGTKTGYTNKTSATSVRIEFAYACPFPCERASEDFHAWMRMSAHGACFKYTNEIPSLYRIPQYMKYQASRTRLGLSNFNRIKVRVDTDGFTKSLEVAIARKKIKPEDAPLLRKEFYKRLAQTMKRENEEALENNLLEKANMCDLEHLYYSAS